eukprot:76520_1
MSKRKGIHLDVNNVPKNKKRKEMTVVEILEKWIDDYNCEYILPCSVAELSQRLHQMHYKEKQRLLNAFYDNGAEYVGEQRLLYFIGDLCKDKWIHGVDDIQIDEATVKSILNILVENGMSLMVMENNYGIPDIFTSYDLLARIVWNNDHMIRFKANLINKFEEHSCYYSDLQKLGQPALITIHDISMFICGNLLYTGGTFKNLTVTNFKDCIQFFSNFDFFRMYGWTPWSSCYHHKAIIKAEIKDIDKIVDNLLSTMRWIDTTNRDHYSVNFCYLFIMLGMVKQHQCNVLNAISASLSSDTHYVDKLIAEYLLRDLSVFKHEKMQLNQGKWLGLCHKSLKYLDTDWCNEFSQIISKNEQYKTIMSQHVFHGQLDQFVDINVAKFATKVLFDSQCDMSLHTVKVLKDLNLEFTCQEEYWGKLLLNVYEKLKSESSLIMICNGIKKHKTFCSFKQKQIDQILNALTNQALKRNINDLDDLKIKIQNELNPFKC